MGDKVGDKVGDKSVLSSQIKVLGKTTVGKAISTLKKLNYIKRVGANKNGYWKVLM